jgi:hypothetical protein
MEQLRLLRHLSCLEEELYLKRVADRQPISPEKSLALKIGLINEFMTFLDGLKIWNFLLF